MSIDNSVGFELVTPLGHESDYMSEKTILSPDSRRKLGKVVRIGGYEMLAPTQSPFGEYAREEIESVIVGQEQAIEAIIDTLDRQEVRLASDQRPRAVLAFLGPTGVGKTETAIALSRLMTGGDDILKIDCSQYSQGHEVMSLVGAPPSYVGREQKPIFSPSEIEGSSGKVILFDELEKGSGPLFDLMLQITDKGVLQLNNGETVSFRDSVIIMTSNLGAREMAEAMSSSRLGFGIKSPVQDETLLEKTANSAFDDFFRPEFIGRINKKVVFKPLGVEEMQNIIDIKLSQANKEYRERFGAGITLSEGCRDFLISQALMKPHLGARPLIDQLDQRIHSEFGRHIAADNVSEGMEVRVFHENEVPDEYHNHVSKSLVFAVKPNIFMKKPVSAPSPLRVSDLKKYEQSYPLFISP